MTANAPSRKAAASQSEALPTSASEVGSAGSSVGDDIRETLIGEISRVVRKITHAECAFVRRLNPDGTAEIVGKPIWYGEKVGQPPSIKQPGEGISGLVLKKGMRKPVIVRDVKDKGNSDEYVEAHRKTLNSWERGTPEGTFARFIQSEVCIPLVHGHNLLGAVVAVSGDASLPIATEELQRALEHWQPFLVRLYQLTTQQEDNAPGRNQDHAKDYDAVRTIVSLLPKVTSNLNDRIFFQQMATMLTSHAGLRWHRAMIFVLDGSYPCDARCVAALGGIGGQQWPGEQQRVTATLLDLPACLAAAAQPVFASNDPLSQAVANPGSPWIIESATLRDHSEIDTILTGKRAANHLSNSQGHALISKSDPWLERAAQGVPVFQELAAQCDHLLVPLVVPAKPMDEGFCSIGFVIFDCPYCDAVGHQAALSSTSFICDLLAGHVADRTLLKRQAADSLERYLSDESVRDEIAKRAQGAKKRIQFWSR